MSFPAIPRRIFGAALLLALTPMAFLRGQQPNQSSSQQAGQPQPQAGQTSASRADDAASGTPDKSSKANGGGGDKQQSGAAVREQGAASAELQERYLRKQLELAKHQLEQTLEANEEIPLLYSKLTLLRLQKQVEHAQALLQAFQAREQGDGNLPAASLTLVRNEAEIAQRRYEWALEANREVPGSVREEDLEAYRLKAELARLALRRAEQDDYFDDPMTHLQWQLNRLRSDVLELSVRMEQTESGS